MKTIIEIFTPHAQHYDSFLQISEHTIRGMAAYAGYFIALVSIFLHDCQEPDMVSLFDGNSHGVS